MPVRLRADNSVPDPDHRVIDMTDYLTGRSNFRAHYYLAACNNVFGGQDIDINWADFNTAVNNFITTNGADPALVAIKFVYCYDIAANTLYLRMEIMTMVPSQIVGINEYDLIPTPNAWYKITQGSIVTTTNTDPYSNEYLNSFYYCDAPVCDPSSAQQLSSDLGQVYARTVTFPWQSEILQMYTDNGSPEGAQLSLGACSYVKKGESGTLDIFPHGLVLYLKDSTGAPMLNDTQYVVLFENKGCDMGTLCPPSCNVYIGEPVY